MANGQDTSGHSGRTADINAHAQRAESKYRSETAQKMGVHPSMVTSGDTAEFTGSIIGHDGGANGGRGTVFFSPESTGGGVGDSVQIPFAHPTMGTPHAFNRAFGVNSENPSMGQKWKATGTHKWNPTSKSMEMQWGLRPHNP